MTDPLISPAIIAANCLIGLITGPVGNRADWAFVTGARKVSKILRLGTPKQNHHIMRAAQRAYVEAMRDMAAAAWEVASDPDGEAAARALSALIERGEFKDFRYDGEHFPLEEVNAAIDRMFSGGIGSITGGGTMRQHRAFGSAVVEDLATWGVELSRDQTELFTWGIGKHAPWHLRYRIAFGEELIRDEAARSLFTQERLGEIRSQGTALIDAVGSLSTAVERGFVTLTTDLADLRKLVRALPSIDDVGALCAAVSALSYGPHLAASNSETPAAGIIDFVVRRPDRFGAEHDRITKDIRSRLVELWRLAQDSDDSTAQDAELLEEADSVLRESLAKITLSQTDLGWAAATKWGFNHRVRMLILDKLAQVHPELYSESEEATFTRQYAEEMLRTGIAAASENKAFYKELEPSITFAMSQSMGQVLAETQAMHQTVQSIASQVTALREEVSARQRDDPSAEKPDSDEMLSDGLVANLASFGISADRLTKEQFRVMEYLKHMPRLRISGCAGSGKTIVACEKAMRLSRAGRSTLLLCHSPNLAVFVRELLRGSGVIVSSFTNFIEELAGEVARDDGWSIFDAPLSEQLERAFDVASSGHTSFDAIIVDEGQDFDDGWWVVVEALLKNGAEGLLYIFHDDYQSLHVGRARYPFHDPYIDITRNCRNSSAVLSIIGSLHPTAPATEIELEQTGFVWALEEPGLSPRQQLEGALLLALRAGFVPGQIVAIPLGGFEIEPILSTPVELQTGETWQVAVRRQFNGLARTRELKWFASCPATEIVDKALLSLSNEASPTPTDRSVIGSLANHFQLTARAERYVEANPSEFPPLQWVQDAASLDLQGRSGRALKDVEVLKFFRSGRWSEALPVPTRIAVSRDGWERCEQTLRLLQVGEIKGLEAPIAILLAGSRLPISLTDKYIAASRGQFGLIICDERHRLKIKSSYLRTFVNVTDRRPPVKGT